MVSFIDTRTGNETGLSFSEVILKGIASSGGLFVPSTLPTVTEDQLAHLSTLSYADRAAFIYQLFETDFDDATITRLMHEAYGSAFDDERIAVVREVAPQTHVLELWHGPTSAFKDMALQCMPRFFSQALSQRSKAGEQSDTMHILVATSGDTGKAALDGFASRPGCAITVLYPHGGVSAIQRKQMVTQAGDNVDVVGVRGNFDDCQRLAKQVFNDVAFNERLHSERAETLSSANSINFGRLMPQIVYYFSAYVDLLRDGALLPGDELEVCVPTGNFGNILGAYYAKRMGLPLGRLLCASNENNILTDFLSTGVYDISERAFISTPSPSMDILISSNLERLLYHLADAERVATWMEELRTQKSFTVDQETFGRLRALFSADYCTNEESLACVRTLTDEYGYLCDPHTAVAWEVAQRLRTHDAALLVVSTAHWAKFAPDVLKALTGTPYDGTYPAQYSGLEPFEQLRAITALAPHAAPIPARIAALEHEEDRFTQVIDNDLGACEERLLND